MRTRLEEVGALACSFTIDELERLESDCINCNTQTTTKIAEEQLPIVPDVERIVKYAEDDKNVRNVQLPRKEICQIFAKIMITDPSGKEFPFEKG